MEYSQWVRYYREILADFGYEEEKDKEAARLLHELLAGKTLATKEELEAALRGNAVNVFGAGPSLAGLVADLGGHLTGPLITADGATSCLLENNLVPTLIVTDLDGKVEDQIAANARGAIAVIHAHGDNMDALKKWVPQFTGKVVGTTQAEPSGSIQNFGGFTDGDRAVYLAQHFGASRIMLIGFDFDRDDGPDATEESKVKARKLTWANVLIGLLDNPNNPKVFFHIR